MVTRPDSTKAWAAPGLGKLFNQRLRRSAFLTERASAVECHYIDRYIREGPTLDLGAGTGRTVLRAARAHAGEFVAMDPAESMLAEIRPSDEATVGQIFPIVGVSWDQLPFADQSFDLVYSFGVAGRMKNWLSVIRPVADVLKPHGRFVFSHKSVEGYARWGRGVIKQGAFQLLELPSQLESVGLLVEDVVPQSLLTAPAIAAEWIEKGNKLTGLALFSYRQWLDLELGQIPNLDLWAKVETSLAAVMPIEAATSSVIIARRLQERGSSAPVDLSQKAETHGKLVYTKVCDVLKRDEVQQILVDEHCFRLACLISPVLKTYCGGRNPIVDLFPERTDLFEETRESFATALEPRLSMAIRKRWGELVISNVDRYNRNLNRLRRLLWPT